MQTNVGTQVKNIRVWDGAAATLGDVTTHTQFGFQFTVTADIAADAVFTVQAANPTDADPCIADAPFDVEAVAQCDTVLSATGLAEITIPAGTLAGSVCAASIPCRPAKFVGITGTSGDVANAVVDMLLAGPKA